MPIVADSPTEAARQANLIAATDAEMVEWRADCLAEAPDIGTIVATTKSLAAIVAPRPLIFTWRTASEGGRAATDERCEAILAAIIETSAAALVDVEIHHGAAAQLMTAAARADIPVIGSTHFVDHTPPPEVIMQVLEQAEQAGASVAKVAVAPLCPSDVATLLAATAKRAEQASVPLVTMAMGPLGLVSRVFGHVFGSRATFATIGVPSAPGQPSLIDLRAYWAA